MESKTDAVAYDDELRRRRRLGELGLLPGSQETLDEYVCQTWAQTHAVTLATKTAKHYGGLYDLHIRPYLGGCKLGELSAEMISRWQAERIAAGVGREAVLQALMLLGSILQRAVEGERIAATRPGWCARSSAGRAARSGPSPRSPWRSCAPSAGSATRC
jgi:hypothetical protein